MNAPALAWGFAEATLFFIVPDVWLTWIALHKPRWAWIGCLWALAGALIGGTSMYAWGAADPGTALAVLDRVPAISDATCRRVDEQLCTQGATAMFLGPLTGTPYKVYAVQAGVDHTNLFVFLLVSVPARLVRFALLTGLVILACRIASNMRLSHRRVLHLALWTVFYAWFFWNVR